MYKRIFHAFFYLLPLFSICSCEDVTDIAAEGVGNLAEECILPATARVGDEVIVQWNGFKENASLSLIASDGNSCPVEDLLVTSSGVSFYIPVSVSPGIYALHLSQDGDRQLGSIEILYPDMPVVGLSLPSYAESGSAVIVGGAGFASSAVLILVSDDGQEIVLNSSAVNAGLSVEVPGNVKGNVYSLYLEQDGLRWLLSSSFRVIKVGGGIKRLVSLQYFSPYSGSVEYRVSWDITYGISPSLKLTQATVSGDAVEEYGHDEYVSTSECSFSLIDGLEESNDLEIMYRLDEQGQVDVASVLRYGDDSPTDFIWNYDAEGHLLNITYESSAGTRNFRTLEYEDGNLTLFRSTAFHYEDPQLFNAPGAPDVVWGFMSLNETTEPSVYIPYLLGWYAPVSANIPSAMTVTLDSGLSSKVRLSYEFDEEGYVTCMKWKRGRDDEWLVFIYDLI